MTPDTCMFRLCIMLATSGHCLHVDVLRPCKHDNVKSTAADVLCCGTAAPAWLLAFVKVISRGQACLEGSHSCTCLWHNLSGASQLGCAEVCGNWVWFGTLLLMAGCDGAWPRLLSTQFADRQAMAWELL